MGKLNLDPEVIERARHAAMDIAGDIQRHIDAHTTTTIERATARLLGVDGVDAEGVPLPNVIVDQVHAAGCLDRGISLWLGRAMARTGLEVQEVAEATAAGHVKLTDDSSDPELEDKARRIADSLAEKALARIDAKRAEREEYLARLGQGPTPLLYVIVATGNIYEDVVQAKSAARLGADIIAVIRSTAQSLLDYVPYGPTTEGYGGTYATQANFRIMREALDEVSEELGRYIMLVNYASGLCMPEIAAMGAVERLDMMLNDAMYGILFRDINMQRTFADQHFSRMINAYAGIIINTGEDNYLTTDDAIEAAHTVLASQFINEALALRSGLKKSQMGLGHAFEMNPETEDGFLLEVAQAEMAREVFPEAPLKYMPPTKYMTGNIFRGHLQDGLFDLAGVMTGQTIQLLGILTEAVHTPFMHDRYLAIEGAKYIFNNARHLRDEIIYVPGGKIQTRAREVLAKATETLETVKEIGLMAALERGMFARIARDPNGGRGLDGVVKRAPSYYNPVMELLETRLGIKG